MKTDVSDRLMEAIRTWQRRMMGNLLNLRRTEPLAPNVEGSGIVQTDVPARITAGYGTFRDVADRFGGITPYTITVPHDIDVRPGDSWIGENGDVFFVKDVRTQGTFHSANVTLCDWVH